MKITLMTVGRLKESYWKQAVAEYSKRLGGYTKLDIIEIEDEKTPDQASSLLEEQIKNKEGMRLAAKCPKDAYIIALAINGKKYDSVELSNHLEKLTVNGKSHIVFIIGGSLGLSSDILKMADEKISFSDMTFPHQLMRVILLEQIYRCFRIQKNEPYHK